MHREFSTKLRIRTELPCGNDCKGCSSIKKCTAGLPFLDVPVLAGVHEIEVQQVVLFYNPETSKTLGLILDLYDAARTTQSVLPQTVPATMDWRLLPLASQHRNTQWRCLAFEEGLGIWKGKDCRHTVLLPVRNGTSQIWMAYDGLKTGGKGWHWNYLWSTILILSATCRHRNCNKIQCRMH